jgi:hypothetical protein
MAAHNTQATGAGTNNFGVWAGDGLGARLAANRKLILIGALIGLAVVVIIVAIVTAVVLLGGSSSAAGEFPNIIGCFLHCHADPD